MSLLEQKSIANRQHPTGSGQKRSTNQHSGERLGGKRQERSQEIIVGCGRKPVWLPVIGVLRFQFGDLGAFTALDFGLRM